MFLKGFTLVVAVALAAAAPQYVNQGPQQPAPASPVVQENLPATYEFHYNILSPGNGDIKSQTEIRDGFEVNGEYVVVQPDGCVRTVRYMANAGGFVPEVSYSGNCDPAHYQVAQSGAGPDGSYKIEFQAPVPQQQHEEPQYHMQQAELAQPAPEEEGYWMYEQVPALNEKERREEFVEAAPAQYEAPAATPERYEDKPEQQQQFEEAAFVAQHEQVYGPTNAFSPAEPQLTYEAPMTTTQAPTTPAPVKIQHYEAPELKPEYVEPAPLAAPAPEFQAPAYEQELSAPAPEFQAPAYEQELSAPVPEFQAPAYEQELPAPAAHAAAAPQQELTYEVPSTTTQAPAAPVHVEPEYDAPRPKHVYTAPAPVRPASPAITTTEAPVAEHAYAPAPTPAFAAAASTTTAAPIEMPTYEEAAPVHEAPLKAEHIAPALTVTTTAPIAVSSIEPAHSTPAEATYNAAAPLPAKNEYSRPAFHPDVTTTTAAPVIVPAAEVPSYRTPTVVPAKPASQPVVTTTTPAPIIAPVEQHTYNAPVVVPFKPVYIAPPQQPSKPAYTPASFDAPKPAYTAPAWQPMNTAFAAAAPVSASKHVYSAPVAPAVTKPTFTAPVAPATPRPAYSAPLPQLSKPMHIAAQPQLAKPVSRAPAPVLTKPVHSAPAPAKPVYRAPVTLPAAKPAYSAPISQPAKPAYTPAAVQPIKPVHTIPTIQSARPIHMVPVHASSNPAYSVARPSAPSKPTAPATYYRKVYVRRPRPAAAGYKTAPMAALNPAQTSWTAPSAYRPAPAPSAYRPAPAPSAYRPAPAPSAYRPAPAPSAAPRPNYYPQTPARY